MRKLAMSLFIALLVGGLNIGVGYAAYPDEPLTIVVPFNVGGSNDIGARTVQP